MFRMAGRVNRKTGRERPFRPRLGGCLLWILILIAILLVAALFFGGVRKGTSAVRGDDPTGPPGTRVAVLAVLPATHRAGGPVRWAG
jgi:hypothetical protein